MTLLRQINKVFLIYLIILSIAGCVIVWLATSRYGAGLSSDAIRIISAGQNFIEGRGVITSSGAPLIFCPPFYSILLGGLSVVFHSDVFTVGMILNILAFGAMIFSSGYLFSLIKPNEPIYAILGSLVVFSSPSLVRISANVAPDPLFILFVIFFLIQAVRYMRTPSARNLIGMLIAALLGASQRYLGLTLVLSGAALILYQQRDHLWQAVRDAAIFSFLSSAPTVAWIIFHNLLGYGTFTGPRFDPLPWKNLVIALQKLVHWFIPGVITNRTGIWIWVALAATLLIIGFVRNRKRLNELFTSDAFIPSCVFFITYGLTLIYMLSYKEHRPLLWDRIHIVILVPFLMLVVELLPVLGIREFLNKSRILIPTLLIGFGLWLTYPLVSTAQYVSDSIKNGEASLYNIHNTRAIRDSELAGYLISFKPLGEAVLYSNYNETAWFLTRRQIYGVPTVDNQADWPGIAGEMYLIWFDLPELNYMPQTMLTLEEIKQKVNLVPVYNGRDGAIFRMIPFPPQ